MSENLYKTLNLHPKATRKQIKSAFRDLAKLYHPDLNPDDPVKAERFNGILEAYAILSDSKKRAVYDKELGLKEAEEPTPFDFGKKTAKSREKKRAKRYSYSDKVKFPGQKATSEKEKKTAPPSFKECLETAMQAERSPYVLCSDGIIRLRSKVSEWMRFRSKRKAQTKWRAYLFLFFLYCHEFITNIFDRGG